MRFVRIGDKDITLLSNEDMARFIERIYRTIDVQSLMRLSHSAEEVKVYTARLSEFLVQYAISTGDISEVSIGKISKNFIANISRYADLQKNRVEDKTGRMAKEILFEDVVMPEIIQYWGKKLNLNNQISLNNITQILDAVSLQSQNNVFHTHSFNSAILPEVEQNGLDISREYFKAELQQFTPVGHQPFKTGVLNTCELSDATFGYASIVPERVRNTFASSDLEKQDGEQLATYLKRSVEHKLANMNATNPEQSNIMKNNAYKIIDFYYGHTKASIAVIRQNEDISVHGGIHNAGQRMVDAMSSFVRMPETRRIFSTLSLESRRQIKAIKGTEPNALELLDNALNNARNEGVEQESAVREIKKYLCGYCMCRQSLNNFTMSNGSGYDISGGKLDRTKFAIATYDDPFKLYSFYKSRENQDKMQQ